MDLISRFEGGYRYFGYWSSPQRYGNQFKVYCRKDIVNYLNRYNGVENCGISVATFKGSAPLLLYLPFDFDSLSFEDSLEDARKLYNEVIDQGWTVTMQDSGFRGFHVLIHTEPNVYSKNQIRIAQESYMNNLELESCDTNIFGDTRRLIRIPGTCHAGKFIKKNGSWKRKGEGTYCRTVAHYEGELMNLNKLFFDNKPEYDFESNGRNNKKPKHPLPCLEHTLKHYRDEHNNREPPQLIRYSYVAYWLNMGKEPSEIYDMLESKFSTGKEWEWYDWDSRTTMSQINHIASNGNYHPLRCNTLKQMGYCLDNCEYNIDKKIKFKKMSDLNVREKKMLRVR
jgi:hypothetical protein